MARSLHQIPETWKREGPKAIYLRPAESTCTAERIEVYGGYCGDTIVRFILA